ncbi:MAG: HD-GYP domain-containing protein [Bacteriovoracales bacterium]|nr:HD-GYP domain-containing protein [Bacteriovoracales bacterium]
MEKKRSNIIALDSLLTTTTLLKMSEEIDHFKRKHKETCEMAARAILYALDLKDHYTFGHSMRVAYFCVEAGKRLSLLEKDLYDLELAALFHDIGKIGTPDKLLNKPTRLVDEEFKMMKKHPVQSYEILRRFEDFEKVALCAKHHHERYDGKGYPDGLVGEEIPLFSRIILIADTFDAVTSSRPYRTGLSHHVAFEELKQFAGTQFDPHLVDVFIKTLTEIGEQRSETFELSIIDGKFKKEAA